MMSLRLRHRHASGPRARGTPVLALLAAALLLPGCRELVSLRETMGPATPHEAYARSLRGAGLHEAALGREWLAAAGGALRRAHPVALPHREAALFPPDEPGALGFRFSLREGERLRVAIERDAHWSGRAIVDLF
ncbi:MAG TPA: hypothetical protein VHG28_13910, partial [Longimicrobiaceae bacterium]|nr:hypothetical protein [Longimicrobiaceae bacterium]